MPTFDLHLDLDVSTLEAGMRLQGAGPYDPTAPEFYTTFAEAFAQGVPLQFRLFYRGMGQSLPSFFDGQITAYAETWDPHTVSYEITILTPVMVEPPD